MDLLASLNAHAEECNLELRFLFAKCSDLGVEFSSELSTGYSLVIGSEMDFANLTYRNKLCDSDNFIAVASALDTFLKEEFGLKNKDGQRISV